MVHLIPYQKSMLHLQIKLVITPFANSLHQWHDLEDEMQFYLSKHFVVDSILFM